MNSCAMSGALGPPRVFRSGELVIQLGGDHADLRLAQPWTLSEAASFSTRRVETPSR